MHDEMRECPTGTAGTVWFKTASPFEYFNDPARTKRLSLEDCIELALKHNLDLQIDRYNPEISLYALRADYAPYDPILSLSGSLLVTLSAQLDLRASDSGQGQRAGVVNRKYATSVSIGRFENNALTGSADENIATLHV